MRLPIREFQSALLELQRGEEVGAMRVHRAESSASVDSDEAGILLRDSTSRRHVMNLNGFFLREKRLVVDATDVGSLPHKRYCVQLVVRESGLHWGKTVV